LSVKSGTDKWFKKTGCQSSQVQISGLNKQVVSQSVIGKLETDPTKSVISSPPWEFSGQ